MKTTDRDPSSMNQPIAIPLRWRERLARVIGAKRTGRVFSPEDFVPALKTRLLILQPTPFCNIRCSYCYLPDRDNRARMSLDTVRAAVRGLTADGLLGETLTVVWHAGEPLVVEPSFYREAFKACAAEAGSGCTVTHAIQTNATLIDDAWCELFREHGVQIGVSVDGPATLHDAHRRTRGGKGTHAKVMAGMARLREHGIGFHAIAVVGSRSLAHARDIAEFFRAQGVERWGCNFDEAEGPNARSSLEGAEDAHVTFLAELFEACGEHGSQWQVREFGSAFRLIAQGMPRHRWRGEEGPFNAQVVPFALLNVAWNGDFGTFSPELLGQPSSQFEFRLGNVHAESPLATTSRPSFQALWAAIADGTRACHAECPQFDFCGGGAPANKLYETGRFDAAETLYCRTMIRRPFDLVLNQLEARRGDWQAQAAAAT